MRATAAIVMHYGGNDWSQAQVAGLQAQFADESAIDTVFGRMSIVPSAADAWGAQIVCKVKEPQHSEVGFLRADLVLFTYLHLAAYPDVAAALERRRQTEPPLPFPPCVILASRINRST